MPLFQQSVIKKHIESFDAKHIEERWLTFKNIFHSAEKQQNIRNSKEEQYQEGFLRDLFVTVLGYIINPEPNFNLLTEQKNSTNSKKADGAILITDSNESQTIVAVIELKGTETTDLNKIEIQAFGYKNNQPGCNYIITSNFEKLRFYIDNTTQQEEFNLFTLTKAQFEVLYACLSWESISKNIPMQILNESVSKENVITKSLYKDYSEFKRGLFANLVELNPQYDKMLLFKKTQKLLDRFLFIFFAEDRGLLPTNLIFRINKEWENIIGQRIKVSLYDRYKMYFNDLNVGAKVTLPAFGTKTGEAITAEFEIFAYNGGLFQPDELLDNIQIDDTLLHAYSKKMSDYNFESDVDVNILGHIFENSLNEIDEIKNEISSRGLNPLADENETSRESIPLAENNHTSRGLNPLAEDKIEKNKTISRRKKDGVFYTPKYITKYIVDNTVGKLCTERKVEIQLNDEDYITDKKLQTKTKKALLDKLSDYRNWLLDLTICDPACGSGAFLNQALEFLIGEHRYVDELQAKLLGEAMILSDIESSILERNIYGVDLNDESVEIAKLSLWLRTAQKGRKLNSLSSNIKCGNSLIDDPAVAGEKAFYWEKEFPEIFKEKNKFAYHITTAIHDSRTSERMIDFKARERRFEGTKPKAEVIYMTKEEEELIASTVAEIAKEDQLNIAAFNLCRDHMHILLVCEEEEVPKIMHKIKGRTARVCNANRENIKGINPLGTTDDSTTIKGFKPLGATKKQLKDNSTPFWTQKYGCKPITSEEQFFNTLNYIEHNKVKHNLPDNIKLKKIIQPFIKTYEDCFKPQFKGGFDVVIGNPPYVFARDNFNQEEKDYFTTNYVAAKYQINTYLLFMEKTVQIIKDKGNYGLIIPNSWLMMYSGEGLRKYLLENCRLDQIINLEGYSFESANVETVILIANKEKSVRNNNLSVYLNNGKEFYLSHLKKQSEFINNEGVEFRVFTNEESGNINKRIFKNSDVLDNLVEIKAGLQAYEKNKGEPKQTEEDVINRPYDYDYKFDESTFQYLDGKDVGRYQINWSGLYLRYGKHLASPRTFNLFEGNKIIVREITGKYPKCIISTYTEDTYLYNRSNIAIVEKLKSNISLKYIVCILNSSLLSYYFVKNTAKSVRKLFPKIILNDLRKFPIKKLSIIEQQPFIEKADQIISLNTNFQNNSQKFSTYFSTQYNLEKLSTKLSNWYDLEFVDFIKELNKAIKTTKGTPLTKKDEFEWMDLFEENKLKALNLKAEIDKTDKGIDQMVYELYGLTEEEIKIVEKS